VQRLRQRDVREHERRLEPDRLAQLADARLGRRRIALVRQMTAAQIRVVRGRGARRQRVVREQLDAQRARDSFGDVALDRERAGGVAVEDSAQRCV
jgi:hypothetical protein